MMVNGEDAPIACSDCFHDQGLRLDAWRLGTDAKGACPACGSVDGHKLSKQRVEELAYRFFVWGSLHRCDYGGAPVIQFNQHQKTSIQTSPWLVGDVKLFETFLGIGFFHYGPRLWMVGEIEPLKALQDEALQAQIIERILNEYPARTISPSQDIYRIRKDPQCPDDPAEYDSAPVNLAHGRLDSGTAPVLYASEDLEICVHECRVTAEDEVYVATLQATRPLKVLDLTALLKEDHVTEFESLDLTVHMLFLAGKHSYPIARNISRAAASAGFDGIIYPSYFSLLRLGAMPFQTTYGLSHRIIPQFQEREQSTAIPNIAIFGQPIADGIVNVKCVNRLMLTRVAYGFLFGPARN